MSTRSFEAFEEIPRQPESEPWNPPLAPGQNPHEFNKMLRAKTTENPYGSIDPQTENDMLWDDFDQAEFNAKAKKLVPPMIPMIGPGNLSHPKK